VTPGSGGSQLPGRVLACSAGGTRAATRAEPGADSGADSEAIRRRDELVSMATVVG